MRRVYALVGRSVSLETCSVTVMLWPLLALWRHATAYMLFTDPLLTSPFELPLHAFLFAALGITYFAWMTLYVLGLVGGGSGAGFRLAMLGIAARLLGSLIVVSTVSAEDGSNYCAVWRGTGLVWWVRNLGIVAFGWGIALVVIAAGMDLVRRRHRPRWMPVLD